MFPKKKKKKSNFLQTVDVLSSFFFSLKLNEEFWQYNTFQYWRNPLPPIDLADIEEVLEDSLPEATLQSKNEVVEIDMES